MFLCCGLINSCLLVSVVGEMKRRFLDAKIIKLSKAADAVMALNDEDGTIQELLTTYNAVLGDKSCSPESRNANSSIICISSRT